jgi:3-oxoacyl-(acyl-carrier-protein) synthase III
VVIKATSGAISRNSCRVLVIVAPGQGAQTPGFLIPWITDEVVAAQLNWLSTVTGLDLAHYGTNADADTIKDTAIAQPLLVAAGLCALKALFPDGGQAEITDLAAGHSVGEITAAALSGVLSAEQAMVFVRERGAQMAKAAAAQPTAMTAVIGGDPQAVLDAITAAGLTAANHNGSGQIVAAGTLAQLEALAANPPARARLIPLSVAGAFHTQHMKPAQTELAELAKAINAADPKLRLLSNFDGQVVTDGNDYLARLVSQVAHPVRWDLCLQTMADLQVTGLLELPPAGTLAGIAKRNLKGVEIFSLNTPDQLDEARAFIARHTNGATAQSSPESASAAKAAPASAAATQPSPTADAVSISESQPVLAASGPDGAPFARIISVGSAIPSRVLDNAYMCQFIDSSDEWITQRTGIKERRWIGEGEDVRSLALTAARNAIAKSGLDLADIDGLIISTVSHFYQTPALAPLLATELGLVDAVAFDISAACAGFCHGVAQAEALVRAGHVRNVIVIGAETLSRMTDITDRATAFLFADGAGAVIIGPAQTNGIGPVIWGSDGGLNEVIWQSKDWAAAVQTGEMPVIGMNGQAVFKWATSYIATAAKRALDAAGISAAELDVFIPHQANDRITNTMLRYLKLPEHVVVARSIKKYGNNSAASIPIAMDELLSTGQAKAGQKALIIGFGAGLVYAGQVVTLPGEPDLKQKFER